MSSNTKSEAGIPALLSSTELHKICDKARHDYFVNNGTYDGAPIVIMFALHKASRLPLEEKIKTLQKENAMLVDQLQKTGEHIVRLEAELVKKNSELEDREGD